RRERRLDLVARLADRADDQCCHRNQPERLAILGLALGPMPLPKSIDTGARVQHKVPIFRNVKKLRDPVSFALTMSRCAMALAPTSCATSPSTCFPGPFTS